MNGWRFSSTTGLVLVMMLQLSGCAPRQVGPDIPAGRIVDAADGSIMTGRQLAARIAQADYVLIGETHDVWADHQAQAAVIELAAKSGLSLAVGLEMLPHSRFDRETLGFSRGEISLEALPQAVDWEKSWGFPFDLYAAIFRVAQAHAIPVYGLNLDRETLNSVRRLGMEKLGPEERERMPTQVVLPPDEQTAVLRAVFDEHSHRIAEKQCAAPDFNRFLLVQSLWDSTMADQAARVRQATGLPVVILAGRGHVEKAHGIAHRLRQYDPASRILSILPLPGLPGERSADVYILTE